MLTSRFYHLSLNLSGSSSLYFSKDALGCHSAVFSRTDFRYSKKPTPCILHESAIVYNTAATASSLLGGSVHLCNKFVCSGLVQVEAVPGKAGHNPFYGHGVQVTEFEQPRYEGGIIAGVEERWRRCLPLKYTSVLRAGMYPVYMLDEAHGNELVPDGYPLFLTQRVRLLQIKPTGHQGSQTG